jgi:hypothetical protein
MEMSGQLHASAALPSGKMFPMAVEQEAGWAPEPVWTLQSREKCLSCAWNHSLAMQPLARRCTDWVISAHCIIETMFKMQAMFIFSQVLSHLNFSLTFTGLKI